MSVEKTVAALMDTSKSREARIRRLRKTLEEVGYESRDSVVLFDAMLAAIDATGAGDYNKMRQFYAEWFAVASSGPTQIATILEKPRGRDILCSVRGDQTEKVVYAADAGMEVDDLVPGDAIRIDKEGVFAMRRTWYSPEIGGVGTFNRMLTANTAETTFGGEKAVVYVTEMEEKPQHGDQVLMSLSPPIILRVMPKQDAKYRFLKAERILPMDVEAELGSPHPCLNWLVQRTRLLMFHPSRLAQYHVRPRVSMLMSGPTGTGKTMHIKAFLSEFAKLCDERTGRHEPRSRVVRVKMAEQLSCWLGESDKNFDRLFTEVAELAAEEVECADGSKIKLPVVLVLEEIDSLARRRGHASDDGSGVMDRIMGTVLQRLDDPTDQLSQLPLVMISTTNRPDNIDAAMQRRLGQKMVTFGRLDRHSFRSILGKKLLQDFPYESSQEETVGSIVERLYDSPWVPIDLVIKGGDVVQRYGRDLMTGAVIEQAVSDAIDDIVLGANGGVARSMSSRDVLAALERQAVGIVSAMNQYNVADYMDVPEGRHIDKVRLAAI